MKTTTEQICYHQQVTESEGTQDIPLPDLLKDIQRFKDWDDHLNTYLRTLRGAAKCPLVYVIREDEAVTPIERAGTVGDNINDEYRNWDDYAVWCTIMSGTHWESDNMALWQIISKLARDGPGWDYIRHLEKGGQGNGRLAYNLLYDQANMFSTVRIQKQTARTNLKALAYHGNTRSWTFDKYVRGWLKNLGVLKRYEVCPKEDKIVQEFCNNITDSRLDAAISNVLVEDSPYMNDFEKNQRYLTKQLATDLTCKAGRKAGATINVSVAYVQREKTPFTGTIEGKNYPKAIWFSMSKHQQEKVQKLRKLAKEAENELITT